MNKIIGSIVGALGAAFFMVGSAAAGDLMRLPLDQVKWAPVEGMPKGFFTAVIREDPVTKAHDWLFKVPGGGRVPPHWHSANETVVMLKGTLLLAGPDGKPSALKAGGYAYIPAKTVHGGTCEGKGACVMYGSSDAASDMNIVDEKGNPIKP